MTEDSNKILLEHVERLVAEVAELKHMMSRHNDVTDYRAKGAARQARYRASKLAATDEVGRCESNVSVASRNVTVTRGTIGGDLVVIDPEKKEQKNPPNPPSGDVTQIFEHWRSTWNKGKAELTGDRRKKIQARLKDGYAAEILCDAISGSKLDTWEGRKDNCDVSQLMKPANIDKFAEMWAKRQMNGNAPLWQRQGFTSPEEYAKHLAALPSESI